MAYGLMAYGFLRYSDGFLPVLRWFLTRTQTVSYMYSDGFLPVLRRFLTRTQTVSYPYSGGFLPVLRRFLTRTQTVLSKPNTGTRQRVSTVKSFRKGKVTMETFFGKRSLLINIKIEAVMNKNIFMQYFDLFP